MFISFLLPFLMGSKIVYAAAEESAVQLPPIVKEGTVGEVLLEDAIVPPLRGTVGPNASTGSILNSFQDQIALPVSDYGQAGGLAQIRGFGSSAEDVDVQAFGISLNPPQGGGFDLSIFPQFLWTGYLLQNGPSLNSLNQSASAGTLSLIPWTARAISEKGVSARGIELYSTRGVNQISAAGSNGDRSEQAGLPSVAAVAGYSSGDTQGPSGSISSRWSRGVYSGEFHLLATHLKAQTPGPTFYPTPLAQTENARVVPVLESDFSLAGDGLLKTTLFYDWGSINYTDPSSSSFSQQIQQWGSENVLLLGSWKIGISARQVSYSTQSVYSSPDVPVQSIGNIQLSRDIELEEFTLEPAFQGVWVSSYGLLPEGTFGAKKEWDQGRKTAYSRVSFSRRIPSLLDRYSNGGGFYTFVGNPDLQVETDWTGTLGAEMKWGRVSASLQGYGQYRLNPRVYTGTTVTNLNDGYVLGLTGGAGVEVTSWLKLSDSVTLTKSWIGAVGAPFPYMPVLMNVFGVTLHSVIGSGQWEWFTAIRASSSSVDNPITGSSLSGYALIDSTMTFKPLPQFYVMAKLEDAFDQQAELIRGYPFGRAFSILGAFEL